MNKPADDWIRVSDSQLIFRIRVTPKAKRSTIGSCHDGALKVAVCEVPESGKANKAVIASLAKALAISKSTVSIQSGETSRVKTIAVTPDRRDQLDSISQTLQKLFAQ